MSQEIIQIRMLSTGGQGGVVLADLLANAAVIKGYHAGSFTEYGTEIRGGRVVSHIRISEDKLTLRSRVYEPDYVIVMDTKYIKQPGVVDDLKEGGVVLINTPDPPESFSWLGNIKVVTIDAGRIAREHGVVLSSGAPVISTVVLGAAVGLMPFVGIDAVTEAIRQGKLPANEKNVEAVKRAYHSVISREAPGLMVEGKEATAIFLEQWPKYHTIISPCEADCPAGNEIRRFIAFIQDGRFEEALESLRTENPFPGICGRVCFHPCETNCNRNEYDEGVAINALERAAFDFSNVNAVRKPSVKGKNGGKVAIIGSGPAGMACAYFLALLGHAVTVFEASPVPGGMPRTEIPEYRLPKRVVDAEISQVIAQGVNIKTNTRVGKDISFNELRSQYNACFIAIGAQNSVKLSIPGEDSEGVISGLEFLKEIALGNKVDVGDKVAVIGGGNTAIDAARTAKRAGAREVTIVYRRSAEEMPAYRKEAEEAGKEGIKISYLTMPVQIHSTGKRVDKLECAKTRLGEEERDGRRRPEKIEGANFLLDVDTVIAATGEAVETSFLPDALERDGDLIKVNPLGKTSLPGVYAGGDATTFSRSVAQAIGAGKRAAVGIDIFLKGGDEQQFVDDAQRKESSGVSMRQYLTGGYTSNRKSGKVSFVDLNVEYFSPAPRAQAPELPVTKRGLNFDEVNLGLSKTEAISEASRCFQCGCCDLCENCYIFCPDVAITFDEKALAFAINDSLCKRCGICIHECPRYAISWGRKEQ